MDNGIIDSRSPRNDCIGRSLTLSRHAKEYPVPQQKKNEIRMVVIVVITLIMFLLFRRVSHFKYRHPPFLSSSVRSLATLPPS